MKLIGRGSFTKAYLNSEDNRVYLDTVDPVKEIMALGWFPDSQLFPKIRRENNGLYSMKYYPRVRSLKDNLTPLHYSLYKELRNLELYSGENIYDAYFYWVKEFKKISNYRFRNILLEALDACSDIGSDITFEISPRNIAVHNNKLILLDCFFSIKKLRSINNAK